MKPLNGREAKNETFDDKVSVMLCKVFTAAVLSLGLLSALVVPSQTEAHSPPNPAHVHSYHVYYRTCCDAPWRCAGTFHGRHRAECVAGTYRAQGYETYIC